MGSVSESLLLCMYTSLTLTNLDTKMQWGAGAEEATETVTNNF